MSFPVEAVPDGTILAPHHAYALLGTLVVCWVVGDDYRHVEPVGAVAGSVVGLFGFVAVWPGYPLIGASLAILGPLVALVAILRPGGLWWSHYGRGRTLAAALTVGIAMDDIVNHATGVPSPLDTAWHVLGPRPSAVLAVLGVVTLGVSLRMSPSTRSKNE